MPSVIIHNIVVEQRNEMNAAIVADMVYLDGVSSSRDYGRAVEMPVDPTTGIGLTYRSDLVAAAVARFGVDPASVQFAEPRELSSGSAILTLAQGAIVADARQIEGSVTWNDAGIAGPVWKLSVTDTLSSAAALLEQFIVGPTTVWKLDKTGKVVQAGALTVMNTGMTCTFDVDAFGVVQLGVDSGAPIPHGVKSPDGVGTNIVGGDIFIAGGNGTGTGKGGIVAFKTTPAGASGSTQNASVERARFTSPGHLILPELTTDPGVADLSAAGAMAIYMKNDKLVFAINDAGTINYLSIPLTGVGVLWTHSTTAP